ncbi:head-tail connector protein [uncultured Lactobacillus sp.]|uniref:head-tail connector protein n=1 Tax=uncultured Lactobacillus sp. TaxID=153152 RepID=UPI0026093D94|nr:head-tail connector protein [uncultured Lactobacillus sp.]
MSIKSLLTSVEPEDLQNVKNFCKVDSDLEDPVIKGLILSARKDIIGQVGSRIDDFFDDNPNFEYAVWLKTYHSYNNRDTSSNAMTFEIQDTYNSTINAMKDDYRYKTYLMDKGDEQ